MFGTSYQTVGIDIGQYSVKMACVKKSGKSFTCSTLTYDVLPEDLQNFKNKEGLQYYIEDLLKTYKLNKGIEPVIHITSDNAIIRSISVSKNLSSSALEGAMELELASALPFSIEQVYYDYDTKPGKNGEYLAVAARRDMVDGKTYYLQNLNSKQNAAPKVDVDIFAYERLLDSLYKSGDEIDSCIMLVDIGYSKSNMIVFDNQEYVFNREQQISGQTVTDMMSEIYDISLTDAEQMKINKKGLQDFENIIIKPYASYLAEQINFAIDFYMASAANVKPIDKIILTGGGANLENLVTSLSEHVEIKVALLDIERMIKTSRKSTDNSDLSVSGSLAIGLALEGVK